MATLIAITCASAHGESGTAGKVRLELDDVISSRTASVNEFTGRLALHGLIQSDPEPIYHLPRHSYTALPLDDAAEASSQMFIADATSSEQSHERME